MVLEIEFKALCILSMYSTTKIHPLPKNHTYITLYLSLRRNFYFFKSLRESAICVYKRGLLRISEAFQDILKQPEMFAKFLSKIRLIL